jgi:hypothetical protein
LISQRILWIAPTALLIACCYFIIAEFLQGAPGLVIIGLILAIGFILALMPSPKTKRPYKIMFLTASIISAGFATGLYSGLFESAILLPDSLIDVSQSVAILHLQNNGLTDFTVNEFQLGNVSFTFEYRTFSLTRLARGETKYFFIYFPRKSLAMGYESQDVSWGTGSFDLLVNEELTPLTFQDGNSYPVVLTTDGLLRHRFDVEAKHTLDEELQVRAYAYRFEWGVEINIRINNTGSYYSYIYSIEVAGVTFTFKPPGQVGPQSPHHLWTESVSLSFPEEPGISWSSSMSVNKISATPTPQLSMLVEGETYEILVRTMADKLYTTNVTV